MQRQCGTPELWFLPRSVLLSVRQATSGSTFITNSVLSCFCFPLDCPLGRQCCHLPFPVNLMQNLEVTFSSSISIMIGHKSYFFLVYLEFFITQHLCPGFCMVFPIHFTCYCLTRRPRMLFWGYYLIARKYTFLLLQMNQSFCPVGKFLGHWFFIPLTSIDIFQNTHHRDCTRILEC